MPQPATIAERLVAEFGPMLDDVSEPVDELTLRRIITQCKDALRNSRGAEMPVLYALLGSAYNRGKRHADALESYKKAALLDSTRAAWASNVAIALGDLGRHEEALTWMKKALVCPVKDAWVEFVIHANICNAYLKLSDLPHALESLDAAARISPGNPAANFSLAARSAAVGRENDAVEYTARFVSCVLETERGEKEAAAVIASAPEILRQRACQDIHVRAAVERAISNETESSSTETAIKLPAETWNQFVALVENPPEPTEALRRLYDASRR